MSTAIDIKASSVKLQNLTKIFPSHSGGSEHVAVDAIDLNIEAGELVTLLGPSGCGKTTTLRMLAGFEFPTSGEIMIGEDTVTQTAPNKRQVGMFFQNYALFPHLTTYENIAYGLKIKKVKKDELKERVDTVVKLMQLEGFENRLPAQLSGGQQQRVALARSIVTEPRVLLFDEPLSNLDAKLRVYMREELRKLQQRLNITSLYVTHDQTEAMAISDKVVIMNNGIIEQVGSPEEIYTKPTNHFVANFMGKASFLAVQVKSIDEKGIHIDFEGYSIIVEDDSETIEVGKIAHCVSRPEFWVISETGKFKGNILNSIYFGSFVEYEVRVGEQVVMIEDYEHVENGIYQEGDRVQFHLREKCAKLLPFDSSFE